MISTPVNNLQGFNWIRNTSQGIFHAWIIVILARQTTLHVPKSVQSPATITGQRRNLLVLASIYKISRWADMCGTGAHYNKYVLVLVNIFKNCLRQKFASHRTYQYQFSGLQRLPALPICRFITFIRKASCQDLPRLISVKSVCRSNISFSLAFDFPCLWNSRYQVWVELGMTELGGLDSVVIFPPNFEQ